MRRREGKREDAIDISIDAFDWWNISSFALLAIDTICLFVIMYYVVKK